MAFLDHSINVQDLPVSTSNFEPLPAAWYSAKITGAELKNTKTGTGQYIAVKYDILGPTHQGRIVFGNVNLKNQNETAERIGREQLGEIMRAIGLSRVEDTDQLIGGTLQIKLTVKEASGGYDAGNEVKGFKATIAGSLPVMDSGPTPSKTAGSATPPPWAK